MDDAKRGKSQTAIPMRDRFKRAFERHLRKRGVSRAMARKLTAEIPVDVMAALLPWNVRLRIKWEATWPT